MTQYIFTDVGDTSWMVPADVTSLSMAETVDGGTSGGQNSEDLDGNVAQGVGGQGGTYHQSLSIPVTPGETLSIRVGVGGVLPPGGGLYTSTTTGGQSWVKRGGAPLVGAGAGTTINGGGSPSGGNTTPGIGGGAGGAHGAGIGTLADAGNAGRAIYFDATHGFGDADALYGGGGAFHNNGKQGIVVITATPGGGGGGGLVPNVFAAVIL